MREIKFRAWDKKLKVMLIPFAIEFDSKRITFDGLDYHQLCDFELIQFTGLKDKNGKEIYEGDILESTNRAKGENINVEIAYNDKMGGYCIVDGWHWKRGSSKESRTADMLSGWLDIMKFKVVGNIYDNPGLLKSR